LSKLSKYLILKAGLATIVGLLFLFSFKSFAWGDRGHHSICVVASRLVQEDELKRFLLGRQHMLGHLCTIPDIYWHSIKSESTTGGAPSHYLNPEVVNSSVENLSADFKSIAKKEGMSTKELNEKMGSLWWRADQLFRMAVAEAKKVEGLKSPRFREEKKDEDFPYNKAIYQMLIDMGVMGHFVGDSSMPYHLIVDYDGWQKGRGGIHSYYETAVVDNFDLDFVEKIYRKSVELRKTNKRSKKTKEEMSVIEKMRELSIFAKNDLPRLEAIDKIFKKSKKSINKYGMEFRIPAKRPSAEEMTKKFEALILGETARSALLLAELWDSIYQKGGRPHLRAYKNFNYPITPDYIAPDYLN
jgi:hypothetical protein